MSKHSILIIDDDTLLADNIRLYLERYQWETHVAYTAEDGLKRLEELNPDVLLTDYQLPGKNGMQLHESQYRITKIAIYVVMISHKYDQKRSKVISFFHNFFCIYRSLCYFLN